jgi:hypothetical protein
LLAKLRVAAKRRQPWLLTVNPLIIWKQAGAVLMAGAWTHLLLQVARHA